MTLQVKLSELQDRLANKAEEEYWREVFNTGVDGLPHKLEMTKTEISKANLEVKNIIKNHIDDYIECRSGIVKSHAEINKMAVNAKQSLTSVKSALAKLREMKGTVSPATKAKQTEALEKDATHKYRDLMNVCDSSLHMFDVEKHIKNAIKNENFEDFIQILTNLKKLDKHLESQKSLQQVHNFFKNLLQKYNEWSSIVLWNYRPEKDEAIRQTIVKIIEAKVFDNTHQYFENLMKDYFEISCTNKGVVYSTSDRLTNLLETYVGTLDHLQSHYAPLAEKYLPADTTLNLTFIQHVLKGKLLILEQKIMSEECFKGVHLIKTMLGNDKVNPLVYESVKKKGGEMLEICENKVKSLIYLIYINNNFNNLRDMNVEKVRNDIAKELTFIEENLANNELVKIRLSTISNMLRKHEFIVIYYNNLLISVMTRAALEMISLQSLRVNRKRIYDPFIDKIHEEIKAFLEKFAYPDAKQPLLNQLQTITNLFKEELFKVIAYQLDQTA